MGSRTTTRQAHIVDMPIIAIAEPTGDLLEAVRRLGHESADLRTEGQHAPFDALVIEPADEGAVRWARFLRRLQPSLPIVCVSERPPDAAAAMLEPTAFLRKPVPAHELDAAIERALAA
jgi:CheY-like chemotaxis protein